MTKTQIERIYKAIKKMVEGRRRGQKKFTIGPEKDSRTAVNSSTQTFADAC